MRNPEKFEPRYESEARPEIEKVEEKERKDKLKEFLKKIADAYEKMKKELPESFKKEGFEEIEIPVGDNLRLNENGYKNCFGYDPKKINDHIKGVERSEKKWEGEEKRGEILEEISTNFLYKILGKDFVVLRTSKHDDFHYRKEYEISHGEGGHWESEGLADIIIFNFKNGNMCVIDAICPECMPNDEKVKAKLKNKLAKVYRINKEGGASLEYGLTIHSGGKREGGRWLEKKSLKPGRAESVPIFLFTYSKKSTDELIQNYNPSLSETSETEEEAFQTFVLLMENQINNFERDCSNVKKFQKESFNKIREISNISNLSPEDRKRLIERSLR